MKLKSFRIGGIHPIENKLTSDVLTEIAGLPQKAIFPLSQHIGAPAKPVVNKGDYVKVGQMIADSGGFVSAPIFSSVSGTVLKIDSAFDATGYRKPAIIIKVEGDEWIDSIDRTNKLEKLSDHPEITSKEIIQLVKNAGVTGMGGAGFPTFIKLTPPSGNIVEYVIINGVECEPYITSDYRLMMEHADEIMVGIDLLMKSTNAKRGFIGIEENKPEAIKLLSDKCNLEYPNISVVALKQKYPQGGEKQLVDAIIGRQVPAPPAIPVNVGVIVQNVGTAFAVYEAVMKHKPLIERYTTVTGKRLSKPGNFKVRIGTPVSDLIDNCGGLPDGSNKVLVGGPMMGKSLTTTDVPICKGTNAVTILSDREARRKDPQPCIRCAKCVSACPMGLEPFLIATLSAKHYWDKLEKEDIISCIECGSCQYTCPAHRSLLDNIRLGKSKVLGIIKARNAVTQK